MYHTVEHMPSCKIFLCGKFKCLFLVRLDLPGRFLSLIRSPPTHRRKKPPRQRKTEWGT